MTENNKVVYNGQTLIDLTQDDVTASDVRSGVYFHSADGVRGQGTLTSTSIPTADTIAEWDSDVHMNSEDMTSQEVEDFVDGLNVTVITAVDYIVEQGTSGIWTYRKWNSGIAECWGRTDIVVPTSGAYAVAFPFTFVTITCNSVNAYYGGSTNANRQATKYILTDGSNDGVLDRAVAHVRDYNGNPANPYIAFDFHTIGTWK